MLMVILYPEPDLNFLEDSLLYLFLPHGLIFLLKLSSLNLKIFLNLLLKPIILLVNSAFSLDQAFSLDPAISLDTAFNLLATSSLLPA